MMPLKSAFRSLLKTPVVTTVAVLSMALGIGTNVAIFSIFNQTLLRPLPVPEPDRLVNLVSPGPRAGSVSCGQSGDCDSVFSYPMFRDLERLQTSFTGIAAHNIFGASIAFGGSSEGGDSVLVSGSYFPVLGLAPQLGRLLGPADERERGGGHVVVLSDDYWRRRFAAREDVLEQTLVLNGQPLTIVGVAPRGFHGTTIGERPQVFVPISMREHVVPRWKGLESRQNYWLYMFARLEPGVSPAQARDALNAQYRPIMVDVEAPQQKMSESRIAQFRAREMQLEPGYRGQSTLPNESRQPLTLLFGVTAVVLLICCANVANLLLGRAARRSTEMAVRLSIGAGRMHIVGQLLTESMLLALAGGMGGLLVARWTLSAMAALLPEGTGESLNPQLDLDMLLFAAAASGVTGLLFGLFPAIHSARPNLVTALKASAGQPSGAKAAARFRVTLATAQIALSMALLIAAGLFTKSLVNITRVDLGLKAEKLVVFGIAPELNGYTPQRNHDIFERIEDRLARLPGVTGVTSAWIRLASSSNWGSNYTVQGFDPPPDADTVSSYNYVGAGYLRTLGIPLLSGREFTSADTLGAPKVAIVNEAFLKKFNLGRDAVGTRMKRGAGSGALDIEIVGVARNSLYSEVKGEPAPVVVFPYRQDENVGSSHFYVRTSGSEEALLAAIPRVVRDIDPALPVVDPMPMSIQVLENVSLDRFVTSMSAAFAALATVLAALGLYGVLAYTVSQRTREFGLRMALGADGGNVRRLVLRQVAIMTGIGAGVGLASALAIGRAAESLLFRMNARDPFVFAAAAATLAAVALVAGFIPARRASRVDPMTALRYE